MRPITLGGEDDKRSVDATLPLINVVFLLLIFVMLSGIIRASDPVTLEPAVSSEGGDTQNRTEERMLFVTRAGAVTFRDGDNEAAVIARMGTLFANEDWDEAYLKADRNTDAGRVVELVAALREAGVGRLVMIVERTE